MGSRQSGEKRLHVQVMSSAGFTPDQMAVIELLCQDFSRKEIARARGRSIASVNRHVEKLQNKLDVDSQLEIVTHAIARGMVSISLKVMGWVLAGMGFMSLVSRAAPPVMVEAVFRGLGY